jgi:hypothetical protein
MHELLFAEPTAMTRDDFTRHANALGLHAAAFASCLDSDQTLDKIRGDQAEARRLGVQGTRHSSSARCAPMAASIWSHGFGGQHRQAFSWSA